MAYPTSRGWPAVGCGTTTRLWVPGPYPLHIRSEIAVISDRFTRRLNRLRVERGKGPLYAVGACNKRYIAGTTTWSNHSWALAMDLNSRENPYAYGGYTDFPVTATRALCKEFGFRWGYDYTGKKDAMHFEYMGTPAAAAALTARLLGNPPTPQPYTDQQMDEVIVALETIEQGSDDGEIGGWPVKIWQGLMVLRGVLKTPEDIDGVFGPGTKAATVDFQRSKGLTADGIVGPRSWKAGLS